MVDRKYSFSIISAVYNAENYIPEMVESIVNQTIGFKENVQLILVNDGSRDNSLSVCEKYRDMYPDNIVVVDKPNGGVSSARNEGLKYAKGEFLNFLDSDDKLSENTLLDVYNCFKESDNNKILLEREKFDVVNIPFVYFDGVEGGEDHPQNRKFHGGKRIVNLNNEFTVAIMNVTFSFIRAEAARDVLFDERICIGEDLKYINTVLLKRRNVALLPNCTYYYRKHSDGSPSLISSKQSLVKYYVPQLENLTLWAKDYSENNYGEFPLFLQFVIACDFKEKVTQMNGFKSILKDGFEDYYNRMNECFKMFDDKVIMSIPGLSAEYKVFWFKKKYGKFPITETSENLNSYIFRNKDESELEEGEELTSQRINWYGSSTLTKLYIKDGKLIVEGSVANIPTEEDEELKIYLKVYNTFLPVQILGNDDRRLYMETDTVYENKHFYCEIELQDVKNSSISVWYEKKHEKTRVNFINYGRFCAVGSEIKGQVYISEGYALYAETSQMIIDSVTKKEARKAWGNYMRELRRSMPKYIFYRMLLKVAKFFNRKKIWLISDRENSAGDNGEALFKYLSENAPKNVVPYFIINKGSKDEEKLKKYGKTVSTFSKKLKLLYLLSDANISAHFDANILVPVENEYFRDIVYAKKVVFLQHGVTKDDIHNVYSKYKQNTSLFVCASDYERRSIADNPNYGFKQNEVQSTGFARFDYLDNKREKLIVIMPTWRKYLFSGISLDRQWIVKKGYEDSDFFKFYSGLLHNEKLIRAMKECNYKIAFAPHVNIMPFVDKMEISPDIEVMRQPIDYNSIFSRAALMVTDYSSTAFDFAYMRKPLIYAHFDHDKFFASHTYKQGYFDYEENGFGEVTHDLESTVNTIIDYMKSDCKTKEIYLERMSDFFAHNDKNSCKRITDAILNMENIEPKNSFIKPEKERIPIVLACNDGYVKFVSVTVQSLLQNSDLRNYYDIYVLNTDISKKNKELIETKNVNYSLTCVNVEKFIAPHIESLQQNSAYISLETYYRLVIPSILKDYDKAIYIDCDLVVLGDISEMYHFDIGNSLVGGVRNPLHTAMKLHIEKELELDPYKYINAGVLLMNLKQMREEHFEDKCFELLASGKYLRFMDQDTINLVAKDRITYFDMSWNYEWHFERLNEFQDDKYHLIEGEQEEYDKASQNIKILHYTGDIKPWKNSKLRFGNYFWDYAHFSPYYDEILNSSPLNETYRKYLDTVSELNRVKNSNAYKIGRVITFPVRVFKAAVRKIMRK